MSQRARARKPKKARRPPRKLNLSECVEAFLELVFDVPKDYRPRTQRDARDNEQQIIAFNKAQETLRDVLELNGTPAAKKLAKVRRRGQRQPEIIGDKRVWIATC